MLMLGPADFTVLTGIPGEFSHPTVAAAVEKVASAARNTGKHWAATCGSVEVARTMIELGARLIFHGCDIVFVKQGLEHLQAAFTRELSLRFERPSATGGTSYLGHE
jgi:2-keto-3-deoxy-L-rhamnonate aldolase RhmA